MFAATMSDSPRSGPAGDTPRPAHRPHPAWRLLSWLVAALCFWLVLRKIAAAAARENVDAWTYLARFFGDADWLGWLMLWLPGLRYLRPPLRPAWERFGAGVRG